jgi:hypothetical protein
MSRNGQFHIAQSFVPKSPAATVAAGAGAKSCEAGGQAIDKKSITGETSAPEGEPAPAPPSHGSGDDRTSLCQEAVADVRPRLVHPGPGGGRASINACKKMRIPVVRLAVPAAKFVFRQPASAPPPAWEPVPEAFPANCVTAGQIARRFLRLLSKKSRQKFSSHCMHSVIYSAERNVV